MKDLTWFSISRVMFAAQIQPEMPDAMSITRSNSNEILIAQALILRINLLEKEFRTINPDNEMSRYLLQMELSTAYIQLMESEKQTIMFIQLSHIS